MDAALPQGQAFTGVQTVLRFAFNGFAAVHSDPHGKHLQ